MAALLDVALRPAEAANQEVAQPFLGPGQIAGYSGTIVPTGDPNVVLGLGGSLGRVGPVSIESIRDGTAQTALFSEKLVGINGGPPIFTNSANARRVTFPAGVAQPLNSGDATKAQQFVSACNSLSSTTQAPAGHTLWSGSCWTGSHPGTLAFSAYTHLNTPNKLSCHATDSAGGPPGGINDAVTATSNHSGGVNITLSDGSVRFIKESINTATWWGLGTRKGGEVISSDAF